jgi:hypothetical protein
MAESKVGRLVAKLLISLASHEIGWVCENHPHWPWEGEQAFPYGGAGMPCRCNMSDDDAGPLLPAGFDGPSLIPDKGWQRRKTLSIR